MYLPFKPIINQHFKEASETDKTQCKLLALSLQISKTFLAKGVQKVIAVKN